MAITHIQSRASASGNIDQSLAYTSDVTAGSLLLVALRESVPGASDPVITDTLGNTYAKSREETAGAGASYLYWALSPSGGANTVSVDASGSTATRLTIHEFGGSWPADPTDQVNGNNPATTSPHATPALDPGGGGLVFAVISTVSDVTFSSAGTGFTLGPVGLLRVTTGYHIATVAGSVNAEFAWTGTSNGGGAIIATFLEEPGPTVTSLDVEEGTADGGTAVTITGTDFDATGGSSEGVTFGGTAATSVIFVNSTTITCVTPAHAAGLVDVVVTNGDATSDTLTDGFLYGDVNITQPGLTNGAGAASGTLTSTLYALSGLAKRAILTTTMDGVTLDRKRGIKLTEPA